MGFIDKLADKFSNSTIKEDNKSNAFMHLQKQSEALCIDTEVLMKACESYIKIYNKKSKCPPNLVSQGSSKEKKRAPAEIMSLAALQCSQTLNNTCHLSKVYMEFSDSHRHMCEDQKSMVEALNAYILYLSENLNEFKRYHSSKTVYAKNAKSFVSYQNKLKKQTQPITPEQKSKVELLYKNYCDSLNVLVEKMAELTSNKKEEERTKNFLHLIDNEIDYYQNISNELRQLKSNIEKSNTSVGENRYSEKKTIREYVDEIMGNKLELEDFAVGSQSSLNGSANKIMYENSDGQLSKTSLSSKEGSSQNLGLMDYNGNNYNYDYNPNNYFGDSYGNGNGNDNIQQPNGPSIMNDYNNDYNNSNNNSFSNSYNQGSYNDYLAPGNNKDRSSIFSDSEYGNSPVSPQPPSTNISKRKSVINNENLVNLKPSEKVYNTKELNPKYCKAIYPFNKSMDDELELEANDLIDIIKMFDDGWATGVNLRSGKEGFFPLNCLLEFYVTDKFANYGGSKENSESYVYSSNS